MGDYDEDGDSDFALESRGKAEEKSEEAKEVIPAAPSKTTAKQKRSEKEPETTTGVSTEAPKESTLGKCSLVDSTVVAGRVFHPSLVKDGVEKPGCSMSAFVVGQKVFIMKHWLQNTKAGTFTFELNGVKNRIDKTDCVAVSCCPRKELMVFQKPGTLKAK